MQEYKYRFSFWNSQGSKKFRCPKCNQKRFRRYVDNLTGELMPDEFGMCDRIESCQYYKTVSRESLEAYYNGLGKELPDAYAGADLHERIIIEKPKPKYIPDHALESTYGAYNDNSFINGLRRYFAEYKINELIKLYKLGTVRSGYMRSGVTFPYIDEKKRVNAIQVMTYNDKLSRDRTSFIHAMLDANTHEWIDDYHKQGKKIRCLFGAHLLKLYPDASINIVEAPKTALIAALHFGLPDETNELWLSAFNLTGLTFDKMRVLRDRDVTLYPDVSVDSKSYNQWFNKADHMSKMLMTEIKMNYYLEDIASDGDRERGADLADFILENYDVPDHRSGVLNDTNDT